MVRSCAKLFLIATFCLSARGLHAQTTNQFLQIVQTNFARWDLNHDGLLASNEVDMAVADIQFVKADAAAVVALKRSLRVKKPALPPMLTLAGITAATEQRQPDFTQMFFEGMKRIAGATSRVLFADGLPKLETIHQGKLGNCFCLAPLGAMLARDPAEVAAMFTALTNGNYRVQFGKKTVEVTPPTDAELALSSSNEREGIWVNLYEKAIGTARNEDKPPGERSNLSLDAIARGGSAGTMMGYITGHEFTRFSFKFAKAPASPTNDIPARLAVLREKLTAATREKRLMTCGTIKPTTPGLTPNHAYAVLGYQPETDAVRLWNPQGQEFAPKGAAGLQNGYPTKNGIFEMPVREWVEQFSGMAFETAAPLVD